MDTSWSIFDGPQNNLLLVGVIFHIAKNKHGSLNVPIEHHPTIRYMVYDGYYKVMSNIPKMGHLPTPDKRISFYPSSLLGMTWQNVKKSGP